MDKFKHFMLSHFEKIILVISLMILGLALKAMFTNSEIDQLAATNQKYIKTVIKKIKSNRVDANVLAPYKKQFLEYQNDVHSAQGAYFWAVAVRPEQPPATAGKKKKLSVQEEVVRRYVFGAIKLTAKVQMGLVQLHWFDNPENKQAVIGYRVYRRKVGGQWGEALNSEPVKAWEQFEDSFSKDSLGKNPSVSQNKFASKFKKIQKNKTAKGSKELKKEDEIEIHHEYRYEDSTVHPSTRYQYKVVTIVKLGGLDGKDVLVDEFPSVSINVPRSVKIFYVGGSTMGVSVEIVKFETVEDTFSNEKKAYVVHKSFFTKKGEEIGVGRGGRSVRKVKVGNIRKNVDFASGYTLLDIVNEKKFVDEEQIKTIIDPTTGKEKQIVKKIKVQKKLDYILVLDNETKKKIKKYKIKKIEFKNILNELK